MKNGKELLFFPFPLPSSLFIWAVLAASLLSASCSILGQKPGEAQTAAWDARRTQLEQITGFTVQARVSSGLMGARGNLHWRQRPDDFQMRVSGAFGVSAMNITGNDHTVEIRTANESVRTTDPEGLLREQLGWSFPLRQLRWWVLSLPSPASEAEVELDLLGRVQSMEQDGWTLEFDEYQNTGGLDLPRKFELAGDEVTIKVVVDAWSDLTDPQ